MDSERQQERKQKTYLDPELAASARPPPLDSLHPIRSNILSHTRTPPIQQQRSTPQSRLASAARLG
jgi:hypothetical protein